MPSPPRCRFERNSPALAVRRMTATTRLPTTMARMSRPFDSRMYSCRTMSCPIAHSVSSSDATACGVSAIMVPMPCVPCCSFTMAGHPPTSSSAASSPAGDRAQTVVGTSMLRRVSSCRARSLSRLRAMATAVLRTGHAHHVELTNHREPVVGDARSDARNDDIGAPHQRARKVEGRSPARDDDLEIERIDDADFVAAGACGEDDAARRIERSVARQDEHPHGTEKGSRSPRLARWALVRWISCSKIK